MISSSRMTIMNALRWIIVLPVFVLVSFLAHIGFTYLGVPVYGFGVEESLQFLDGSNMGDHWVSGTIYVLFVRVGSMAAGTYAALKVAPSHNRQTAFALFFCAFSSLMLWGGIVISQQEILESFSFWYRSFIDTVAILGGVVAGISIHKEKA